MKNELSNLIEKGLDKLSLTVDTKTISRLVDYGLLLKKANKATRLVASTEAEDLANHILDSAAVLRLELPQGSILDVGSGGGLPGIPLAILQEERNICLLESRQRRATFLEHACLTLALENAHVMCTRYEEAKVEDMDIAISRAVAAPDMFLNMLKGFPGAHAVVMSNVRVFPVKDREHWTVVHKDTPPLDGTPRHLNVLFEKS